MRSTGSGGSASAWSESAADESEAEAMDDSLSEMADSDMPHSPARSASSFGDEDWADGSFGADGSDRPETPSGDLSGLGPVTGGWVAGARGGAQGEEEDDDDLLESLAAGMDT